MLIGHRHREQAVGLILLGRFSFLTQSSLDSRDLSRRRASEPENLDHKVHYVHQIDGDLYGRSYPHNVPSTLTQVDLAAQSHVGFVRERNEDHYLVVRMSRSLEILLTNMDECGFPQSFGETVYGMLVADGMGGLASGEVASTGALLKLLELVVQTPDWIMRIDERDNAAVVMRRMTDRFRQIDEELRQQGEANSLLHGMGTTLTVAATLGTNVFLSHIGDSRAYLLRSRKLHQLTKDHTLAQAMVDAGLARAEDTAQGNATRFNGRI